MDKAIKMDAIKEMAKGDVTEVEAHMAKCPKCGHEWMMSEDEYEEDESEDSSEED